MVVTKKDIEQWKSLTKEITEDKSRLRKQEKLAGIPATDTVTGSTAEHPYTKCTFKIQGISERDSRLIHLYRGRIQENEQKLMEVKASINMLSNEIEDSVLRRIIRFRYVDNLEWRAIASRIYNNANLESTVRSKVERFLAKN
ncbi:MAG: hypothetical protein RRZ24_11065 [Clostridia bacterium]